MAKKIRVEIESCPSCGWDFYDSQGNGYVCSRCGSFFTKPSVDIKWIEDNSSDRSSSLIDSNVDPDDVAF